MKHTQFLALALAFALFTTACTQENTDADKIQDLQDRIKEIEKENDELKEITGDKGIKAENPVVPFNDDFLKSFCDILAEEDPSKKLSGYVSDERLIERLSTSLKNLKQRMPN